MNRYINEEDMDFASSLIKTDIVTYLNEKHKTRELFHLKTERDNLLVFSSKITQAFKFSFVSHGESLMNILETYNHCKETLSDVETITYPKKQKASPTHSDRRKKLVLRFQNFGNEIDVFRTPDRYFVNDCYLDKNKGFYILLTNDLLFVGKKNTDSNVYRLVNHFSNKLLCLSIKKQMLEIRIGANVFYQIPGDVDTINKFIASYSDATSRKEVPEYFSPARLDNSFLKYLSLTRGFPEMEEYLSEKVKENPSLSNEIEEFLSSFEISNNDDLKSIMKMSHDPERILVFYIRKRFWNVLDKTNHIDEIGAVFEKDFEILKLFIENVWTEMKEMDIEISPLKKCVLLELLLRDIFKYHSPRVYNKFHDIKLLEDLLKKLENLVCIDGIDFRYLVDELRQNQDIFKKECIRDGKRRIEEALRSMFIQK